MGKVTFNISISLDGYITAPNQTPEQPLGDDGERLHPGRSAVTDNLGEQLRELEVLEVLPAPSAAHLRYRLNR